MGHSSRCDGFGTRSPATAAWLKVEPGPYKECRGAICRLQLSAVPAKLVSAVKEWHGAAGKTTPTLCLSDPISLTLHLHSTSLPTNNNNKKAHLCLPAVFISLHANLWHCWNETGLLSVHTNTEGFGSITRKATARERPLSARATRHPEHLAQMTSARSLHSLTGHSFSRPTHNLHT